MQPDDFRVALQEGLAAPVPVSSSGSQLDVQGGDPQLLAALGHILSGQHGSVWRRLVSVRLHLHPTGHTADRLPGNRCKAQKTGNHHMGITILLMLAPTCRTGR